MATKHWNVAVSRFRSMTIVSFSLLIICFGIAVYGYFISPPVPVENPPNVLLSSNGGDVLFFHFRHSSDDGGAVACEDCHHMYDPDSKEKVEMKCRKCHYNDPEIVDTVCFEDEFHPRCVGTKCLVCHDGEKCTFCHRKKL